MMKRAIVIGCAGAGKSYFARKLRDKTGLPLYHLDNIYWRADGTTLDKAEFYPLLDKLLETEEWIIDGNYSSTMGKRMAACDTVFFLDFPTELCLEGIAERRGKLRSDMAWQMPPENSDEEFVEFIKSYNSVHRPRVLELLDEYSNKNVVIFRSREDAEEYIEGL